MKRVRRFIASVEYKNAKGQTREETFPVTVEDFTTATAVAERYVLEVLKLSDFELRMIGA